jgi:hypothetical protein
MNEVDYTINRHTHSTLFTHNCFIIFYTELYLIVIIVCIKVTMLIQSDLIVKLVK